MRMIWTLPLQFFVKDHILTRKKKIKIVDCVGTYRGIRAAR